MILLMYFVAALISYFFFARTAVRVVDSSDDLIFALFIAIIGALLWPFAWLAYIPYRAWQKKNE